MRSRSAKWWVGAAFAANLFLAVMILVARGADAHGTDAALFATGRVAFLWFWAAYAGGALATLLGATFLPLKQRGREFGLAFAAALFVHLALVSWRCWIGAVPPLAILIRFGIAAAFTLLLALFSLGNLHALLGPKGWQLLRTIGMNYILYVFLYDFGNPSHGGIRRLVEYLPFTLMATAAALLQLAAWGVRLRHRSQSSVC
ncbi:hypothetical protein [Bradyrhizobium genosp. A]|uniref:hypothetical protein n=1 Tax=Bradyrhizobium genosp. A TaxID=83626 RepID=UPI003CEBAED4